VCLEGVEHLVDPVQLIRELVRVTRSRGDRRFDAERDELLFAPAPCC
jgi:hypothetical protein